MTMLRNRVKEMRMVKAADLVAHEANWRTHPPDQIRAMRALLKEIGIAGAILARELPDGKLEVIDGHLRRDLDKHTEWPVLVTDLTAEEARLALLTHDPIAAMAGADKAAMDALLASVHTDSKVVASLLERIAGESAWQTLNDPAEVVEVPAQVDRAAELQAKFGAAPGQAWEIGPHRLVAGTAAKRPSWAVCGATVGRKSGWCGPTHRMASPMQTKTSFSTEVTAATVSRSQSRTTT
jgi:ParB-like chromosome segregation protein Spo0J